SLDPQNSRLERLTLGAVDRLEVVWKGPAPLPQKGPALTAAEAKIAVRVEDATVNTDVTLNLQVMRGEGREWRLLMPPQALPKVREPAEGDDKGTKLEWLNTNSKPPVLVIRLKETSSEPLRVVLHFQQPRSKGLIPIGPVSVFDASRQWGTVTVNAPPDLRLRY